MAVSERSSWANALTPAAPAPPALTPAQPTGLTADPAHDQVGLDWDDPDDSTITGYRILRRLPAQDLPGEFAVLLENTGSTLTSYLDTTVKPQTSYVYRVKAINAHGSSERSSWANALTPAPPVLTPAQPTGLTADPAHDQVGLDWDVPDDSTITGYRILRRLPAEDLPGEFAVLLENTDSALTTYVDTTVTPQTSYVYRVQAINAHGSSEQSSWANALTPAVPPPTGLRSRVRRAQACRWIGMIPRTRQSPATRSCVDQGPQTRREGSACWSKTPARLQRRTWTAQQEET